jgi:hypothetical protein
MPQEAKAQAPRQAQACEIAHLDIAFFPLIHPPLAAYRYHIAP